LDKSIATKLAKDTADTTKHDICLNYINAAIAATASCTDGTACNAFNSYIPGSQFETECNNVQAGIASAAVAAAEDSKKVTEAKTAFSLLKRRVESLKSDAGKAKKSNPNNNRAAIGLGTAGALLGGGLAGAGVGVAMQNARKQWLLDKQNEAVAEWFNEVGSKIQCVVGGKPAGSYGDLIELK
jgi:hypothetical protein